MRHRSKLLLTVLSGLLLGGCATTKVDLYKYKDISSVSIVDDDKANYQVVRPKLNADITVDTNGFGEFDGTMRDYFLAYNDQKEVFKLDQNGSYRLKLTLHNVSSNKKFTPSQYIERKRKIKTDKGIIIKDESYYSDPYWTYHVDTAVVAELTSAGGEQKFFEADDAISYSLTGKYGSEIPRSKYVESLQGTLSKLLKQIANEVAPEGLVVSKKVSIDDEDDLIFLVNMGKSEGLYEGQKLLVFKELVFKDEIDARTMTNKVHVGTATVSNQVMSHYAWMIMDDEDHNHVIDVGDIVRARY
ncbi:hypothetical protein [Sulfuricurvum sp.]|uniref:hypothetical protein n=1 Tax=Sulfuricurvum sp. TaxID=2025608 RepID=UPI003BAEBDCA